MTELQDAEGNTLAGFERDKCVLMNVDGLKLPLQWTGNPAPPAAGTRVRLRFSFRDATLFAAGSD
eukprot:COSAG04_NODE_144_length_22941_cov_54.823614_10_plen_65_part_00